MFGILDSFLKVLDLDKKEYEKVLRAEEEKRKAKFKEKIQEIFIELNEEDNVYKIEKEVVIVAYDKRTNEPIKEEITKEQVPISKTMARSKITRVRI